MDKTADRQETQTAKVAVVVPNWNGLAHLPMCFAGLAAQTLRDFEVFLVDNGSTDGSVEFTRARHPWVKVIELGGNLGFPAAANAGIRSSRGPYVALLNNDTRPAPDWLERIVHTLDAVPTASFAASKLLRFEHPHRIDSAGHGFQMFWARGIDLGNDEPADHLTEPTWVFGACAAAAVYRRRLFDDVGLFDEDFFFSHEDVDLDLRAQIAGHRCVYVPDAIVYHRRGGSHSASSLEIRMIALRNRLWIAGKALPPSLLIGTLTGFLLLAAREVVSIIAHQWRSFARPSTRQPASGLPRFFPLVWGALAKLPEKRRVTRRLKRTNARELLRATRPRRLESTVLRAIERP